MLNTEDYETLKSSFIESQRLFDKLSNVANNYNNIEFDESGLYQEDEDTCKRHWLKLSTKIVTALQENLDSYKIELLKNENYGIKEIEIILIGDDEKSEIKVDFSEDSSLNIIQIC